MSSVLGAEEEGASLADLEALYRESLSEFRRVARAIVGEREAARDAVQEAFANAVRSRALFRGDGPLEAWLWRAVVRAAQMQRRASRSRQTQPLREAVPDTRANGHGHDPDESLRAAIAALPERQRLALFLHYYADLSYADIGQVLNVSPGTVGASLNTARTSLARVLTEVTRR